MITSKGREKLFEKRNFHDILWFGNHFEKLNKNLIGGEMEISALKNKFQPNSK